MKSQQHTDKLKKVIKYSVIPREKVTQKQKQIGDIIVEETGAYSMPHFVHGKFPQILKDAGFKNVIVENITPRIMPMLKIFYLIAYIPYIFIKFLGLQRKFVNATSAAVGYKNIKNSDYGRYNIISAIKK